MIVCYNFSEILTGWFAYKRLLIPLLRILTQNFSLRLRSLKVLKINLMDLFFFFLWIN